MVDKTLAQRIADAIDCSQHSISEEQLLKLLLEALTSSSAIVTVSNGSSFSVPDFDQQAFTYIGSTNNINTIVFKKDTVAVATLTFTYVAAGAADDDKIQTITKS